MWELDVEALSEAMTPSLAFVCTLASVVQAI